MKRTHLVALILVFIFSALGYAAGEAEYKNVTAKYHSIEDLPGIIEKGRGAIIFVPADPEKGFAWPYFLALPGDEYQDQNREGKKFLMVDTTNTGSSSNDYKECIEKTYHKVWRSYSRRMAEKLNTPFLMPVFPRPRVGYRFNKETNFFYTHALDRDTATLHILMKDSALAYLLETEFKKAGFNIEDFVSLDEQLIAMIDNTIEHLNKKYNYNLDRKVFLNGFSASGAFVDRFSVLHPERVKAVVSGATLSDMVIPLTKYRGRLLIYPIGIYDYKEITGRDFSMKDHNQVARLIYMGDKDDNNVVPYNDCYGDREREIITDLWGVEVLPRAKELINLYKESGGEGIFILDKDIGHSYSREMAKYIFRFFKANTSSEGPVYPHPSDKEQLNYKIFINNN